MTCCESCQLTTAWMPKIKDVARYWPTDGVTYVRTYGQSRDDQMFSDRWVTKFSRLQHAGAPLYIRQQHMFNVLLYYQEQQNILLDVFCSELQLYWSSSDISSKTTAHGSWSCSNYNRARDRSAARQHIKNALLNA